MDLVHINAMQVEEIRKHKWIESEKAGRDLGRIAELDWIRRYACEFRRKIEEMEDGGDAEVYGTVSSVQSPSTDGEYS